MFHKIKIKLTNKNKSYKDAIYKNINDSKLINQSLIKHVLISFLTKIKT